MNIDFFINSADYKNYFVDQLVLASTLLGMLIATSIFLLQSGFSSFTYSRTMFLKYYVRMSRFLFLLLGYNILVAIIFLYTVLPENISFWIHVLFSLIFIKYLLDFYSHKGYIMTLHSTKFNPWKNRFFKYLRYIQNLGLLQSIIILVFIWLVTIYPLLLGKFGTYSARQGFISTIISFVFCVLSLVKIIPQYFSLSELEYERKENNEISNEIEIDITQELGILKDTLVKNGRKELVSRIPFDSDDGEIECHLASKKDEAFFVIDLWIKTSNIEQIVRRIEKYSYDFFQELYDINVDINSFVLSYYIRIEGTENSRTFFLRSKRAELESLLKKAYNPQEFVKLIKNKLVDELFRSV